jgi:hypothetical protein
MKKRMKKLKGMEKYWIIAPSPPLRVPSTVCKHFTYIFEWVNKLLEQAVKK